LNYCRIYNEIKFGNSEIFAVKNTDFTQDDAVEKDPKK